MTKLEALQEITRGQFATLQAEFPGTFNEGGCLLLGKRYAHPASRVLMLGINPGASPSKHLDVGLQAYDWLLDGPNLGHHYHTNARKFFHASPALFDAVRLATFAFCCPFRTANWSGLRAPVKIALIAAGRPVLTRIVDDCQPSLIIVAGVDGFRYLPTRFA